MGNTKKLTTKQLKGVEALSTRGPEETYQEVAKRAGVTRKSLWEWWKLEAFRTAVRERVEKLTDAERTPIINALVRTAKSGDVSAMRLFFQLRGELTEKHEVNQTLREVTISERAAGASPK